MNQLKKQDGITLVELLATLAISSIVITIIFQVLFNGLNYSEKAQRTASIQNEANYIISLLTTQHETSSGYQIKLDQNPQAEMITITNDDGEVFTISNTNYVYSFYDTSHETEQEMDLLTMINPKDSDQNHYLSIRLVVQDKRDSSIRFEIKTIISRM
ncbi:prepilin-type N-terminal cleavage/methylation domain-containing protein [Aquibacillus albus]|uniref:Prepilin-type N-terminal cleavage/methylation domain-containing protein n=2 Tax=Aquibacillus albus TaxID=1168171 RepID=A0ABS2MXS3_9BACI|nr:prepilin-type N-terminal cleavage/methylation domain-containing protein [Aquibacillus albus]